MSDDTRETATTAEEIADGVVDYDTKCGCDHEDCCFCRHDMIECARRALAASEKSWASNPDRLKAYQQWINSRQRNKVTRQLAFVAGARWGEAAGEVERDRLRVALRSIDTITSGKDGTGMVYVKTLRGIIDAALAEGE